MKDYFIEEILKYVDEKGNITYEKLNEILPPEYISPENLEEIIAQLEEMGIRIVEEQKRKIKVKKEKNELTTPIKKYFKDISSIPNLSREEEERIAEALQQEYIKLSKAIFATLIGVEIFLKYSPKIRERQLPPEEFIRIEEPVLSKEKLEERRQFILKRMNKVRREYQLLLELLKNKKKIKNAWYEIKKKRLNIQYNISSMRLSYLYIEEILSKINAFYNKIQKRKEKMDEKKFEKYLKEKIKEKMGMGVKKFENIRKRIEKIQERINKYKNMIIEGHTKFVISIAKRYINRGLDFVDLIQEGNSGMIKAIMRFDHRKHFKFSTYASWWIRQAIVRSLSEQAKTIKVPVHMLSVINRVSYITRTYMQTYGRELTMEEIAEKTGYSINKIKAVYSITQTIASLDSPIGQDGSTYLHDFIADKRNTTPGYLIGIEKLKEKVKELLSTLEKDEREVIIMRFGLDGNPPKSLEEIGIIYNVTRERIRQIENKAIRKLRFKETRRQLETIMEMMR